MEVEEQSPFKRLAKIYTKVLPCGGIHDTGPENRDIREARSPQASPAILFRRRDGFRGHHVVEIQPRFALLQLHQDPRPVRRIQHRDARHAGGNGRIALDVELFTLVERRFSVVRLLQRQNAFRWSQKRGHQFIR